MSKLTSPKRVSAVRDLIVPDVHSRTVGIDTDRDFLVVAFLDVEPSTLKIREYAQQHNEVANLVRDLKKFEPELIIIESTGQYHILAHDAISQARLPIAVINPLVISALIRVEGKTDARDAATLARLAASFPLRASNMPDEVQRDIRLTFKRMDEAKDWKRRCRQRLWGHLVACGSTWNRLVSPNAKYTQEMLELQTNGASVEAIVAAYKGRKSVDDIRQSVVQLDGQQLVYARSLFDDMKRFQNNAETAELDLLMIGRQPEIAEVIAILTTIPTVTLSLSLRFIGEFGLDTPQRYKSQGAFCKAIGICPSQEITGGKVVKTARSRGRAKIRYYLRMSVAGYLMSARNTYLSTRYKTYKSRAGHARAVTAQAHKVAQWIYGCWHRMEPFNEYRAYRFKDWVKNPNYEHELRLAGVLGVEHMPSRETLKAKSVPT